MPVYDIEVEDNHNFVLANSGAIAHNCGYSVLTFQTAWLKHYYPREFLLSMFNTAEKNAEEEKNSIKTCVKVSRKLGASIEYPSVNESNSDFINKDGSIIWSLGHIKGIGDGPVEEIIAKRPFKNIEDMFKVVNRKKINKRVFVALYGAHAFDCFDISEVKTKYRELYEEDIDCQIPDSELLREIKYLGLPVKTSYAQEYGSQLDGTFRFSRLNKMKDGEFCIFAGIILESALKKSKAGRIYASLTIEDDNFNKIIVYLKEKDYTRLKEHVEEGKFVKFQAEKIDSTKCRLRGYSLVSLKPDSAKNSCS